MCSCVGSAAAPGEKGGKFKTSTANSCKGMGTTRTSRVAQDVAGACQWPLNSRFGSSRARTHALASHTSTGTLRPA